MWTNRKPRHPEMGGQEFSTVLERASTARGWFPRAGSISRRGLGPALVLLAVPSLLLRGLLAALLLLLA